MITLPPLVAYLRVSTTEALFGGWVTSNEVAQPFQGRTGSRTNRTPAVSQVGSQSMGQNSIAEQERETA